MNANLKIGTRLQLAFALMSLFLIVISAIGISRLSLLNDDVETGFHDRYPKVIWAQTVVEKLADLEIMNRNLLLADKQQLEQTQKRIQEDRAAIDEALKKMSETYQSEDGKKLVAEVLAARDEYRKNYNEYLKFIDEKRTNEAKDLLLGRGQQVHVAYAKALSKTVTYQSELMDKTAKSAAQTYSVARILMAVLTLIAIVLSVFIGILVTRSITKPLKESVRIAKTIAAGDLNAKFDASSTDEFGELLQSMAEMNNALQNVIWHVRQGVDTFTSATKEIASGNQDLSSRTEQQASSLEETASSMEELTSTVRQNADNALQANQLAATASDVAARGGAVVSQVVDTMHSIHESSRKIADIINVIDGIAFQTNILALNAAVEAARAGEQGRGFAVVATEVRSLAQRSASAAREIKTLIDDSVGRVEVGNKLVEQAGTTMNEVVTSIRRVTDIMGEITEASREQSDGIEQVNQAITQMDTVTQQNAALVEQAAAAAESLQGQANELNNVISVFKVKSASYGTTNEAQQMVQTAVSYLKQHGREKGFAEICNRLGRFNDRDLYVVVYDLNGRNLAHGAFPAMVGKDLIDAKDGAGKLYVRERLSIVKTHGKGWQDYMFTNPVTKQMEPKSMYLEQLEDYIVGCGAYKKT